MIRELKKRWSESRRPLIENNNNDADVLDGHANQVYGNALTQNTFNTEDERCLQSNNITLEEVAKLLGVSLDGYCCSACSEPNSGQQNIEQSVVHLIQRSVSQYFAKLPVDPDRNLLEHLLEMQKTVSDELQRLSPVLESRGWKGYLTDRYHRQTFDHLHSLLQNISSSNKYFMLVNWVIHSYQSQWVLGQPDRQLLSEWKAKASEKLLENMKEELRGSLKNILQNERDQGCYYSEEDYIKLYLDSIQCIDAMATIGQRINPELSDQVWDVCLQELLIFVRRYKAEQTEFLGKKAIMDKPETIHFLRTLKTCKELKQHFQKESGYINNSHLKEFVEVLENMEALTLKLLMKIVTDIAESHLKNYFKSDNRRFFPFAALEKHFHRLPYVVGELKMVMDKAYKIIAHTYLKHLIQCSRRKLRCWSCDIGQTVSDDAAQLHNTISNLVPDIQQWNLMLLSIQEVLECESIDALKITVATIQEKCAEQSEDLELLPALLRWKGLSKREVREVLEALPGSQPSPSSGSWFSFLICC